MMTTIPSFRKNLWSHHCLPSARELVRSIVVSSTAPLLTKDIYNLALKQTAIQLVSHESAPEHPTIMPGMKSQLSTRPPHPEHPVSEESGAPGASEFKGGCTKRMLSQAEIDHWLQTVTKAARKEQVVLLAAPGNTYGCGEC
ncbi:hypothetical protein EV424DRAFT_211654 [Suillus variegatus]|nr:hypothetical protein EV424DRAFT_211654 [Suillus variegatus]